MTRWRGIPAGRKGRKTMAKLDQTHKGITLAIIGPSLWGIMGIFVRQLSAAGIGSTVIACLRCLLAGMVFFGVLWLRDRALLRIDWPGILICVVYGASSYGVCFVTYNVAVEHIPVSVATVLMFISPVWVTLLNWLVFHERPDKLKSFAILLCFCGAILVADLFHTDPAARMDLVGVFASLLNSFGMALQLLIPRYFARRYQKDTMLVYGFLGAAAVLAFLSDFGPVRASLRGESGGMVLLCILVLGVVCTLGANGAYVKATAYIDTTSVSILSALEVVVGSVVGFLYFHESMRVSQAVGAVIIMAGALLPNVWEKLCRREERKTA